MLLTIIIVAFLLFGMCALLLVRGGYKEEEED